VDPTYGEVYRKLFESHWWWRSRNELIVDKIHQLQSKCRWRRILDVGCGDALFFDRLSEYAEVEGVEPFADLVSPNNPHRDRIYVCPFDENFNPGKQYSLILMLDVLEHLENPVGAVKHALDLLAQEGQMIVTVPAFMALWTNHDVLNHHHIRYTKQTFRKVARGAGFMPHEERYLYHWTCPVKLGVHVIEGVIHPKPKVPSIPWAPANETLFWISRLEQKTLSAFPMPFGSTLLVVGSKGSPVDVES
jgi:2-polyprenyl-3-methyl-5-hydroxy-6-metoxy-1,4-benzoquinol methylase